MNTIMNLHVSKIGIVEGRCIDGMGVVNMGSAMGKGIMVMGHGQNLASKTCTFFKHGGPWLGGDSWMKFSSKMCACFKGGTF
jgi:hypothetical protein